MHGTAAKLPTSDHEWCAYAELDGIGIHQLISGSDGGGDNAVTTARFTWNGHHLLPEDTVPFLAWPRSPKGLAEAFLAGGDSVSSVVVGERRALAGDVHELALAMPHVTVEHGPKGNPVYQVGGKSFVFFRTPRPDAADPVTGERYADVIVFWVRSEADKQALIQDTGSPFFTTPHFDGHLSVLVRASRIGELTLTELTEIIQDAWLSRASPSRARAWLAAQP